MLKAASRDTRIFPLSLPPIDWLFYCDDHPEYPMVFYIEMEFSGTLDPGLLSDSLCVALSRHPLLLSKIGRAKGNRLCWLPTSEDAPQVQWLGATQAIEIAEGEYLDITRHAGLRIWARPTGDGAKLTFQFHHAACDGTGAYRFLGDLLIAYGMQLPGVAEQCEFGDVDAGTLRVRRGKMIESTEKLNNWALTQQSLAEAWRIAGAKLIPLRVPDQRPAEKVVPGVLVRSFSAGEHKCLRNLAVESGVMMNDLLLWQLFRTIGLWNGDQRGGGSIRILVPSDMRDGDDFLMPAANMTAYTFVTHGQHEWKSESLLDRIREDTQRIKQGSLQRRYMQSVTAAMSAPRIMSWLLSRKRCLATAILSNAGDPARRFTGRLPRSGGKVQLGDLTLETITGVPPLRRLTHASVSVSSYGRGLFVSMRCDPWLFGDAGTQDFLDLYCDQLKTLTGAS